MHVQSVPCSRWDCSSFMQKHSFNPQCSLRACSVSSCLQTLEWCQVKFPASPHCPDLRFLKWRSLLSWRVEIPSELPGTSTQKLNRRPRSQKESELRTLGDLWNKSDSSKPGCGYRLKAIENLLPSNVRPVNKGVGSFSFPRRQVIFLGELGKCILLSFAFLESNSCSACRLDDRILWILPECDVIFGVWGVSVSLVAWT